VSFQQIGADWRLKVDANNNGVAEFIVEVVNVEKLSMADILL
jgi:hypothetical protein